MSNERHDDVIDLISRAEQARTGRRQKVNQEWCGLVAAHVTDGPATAKALEEVTQKKNSRWSLNMVTSGDNWVSFIGFYVAKGANANDADKLVKKAAVGEVFEVAVDTRHVLPTPLPSA